MENTIAFDWEIAEKFGPTQSMIESCEKIYESGESWRFNCSIRKFPLLIKGYPAYCYTIESQLGQPESEDDILPNNFYFKIELNNFPSEYFKHLDEIFIFAGIHNRRQLINPQKEGVILKGGYDYKIHVSMKQIERLAFPYNTNCTDYLKLWKQNNGFGPLNQDTCIEYCKLKKLKARGLCVDEFTFYEPHTEKVCSVTTTETTTYEMNKHCSMECQPACLEQDYEMEYEEADLETKVKGDIELFSYIGGYIGIWLGISFVSICDLLESLCQLFCYTIKTKP
nr:uncharacterized protein LOC107448544 [Parasteatoda tepidariorum]